MEDATIPHHKQDASLARPGPAPIYAMGRDVAYFRYRFARQIDAPQRDAVDRKNNGPAVRRPERTARALGTSDQPGICGIERPDPQTGLTLDHADESRSLAVG